MTVNNKSDVFTMPNQAILQEIKKAAGAHGAWKLKLSTAVSMGTTKLDPKTVKCDDLCDFGKWLHGSTIDNDMKFSMPYKVIKRLHAEFHVCASEVLEHVLQGDVTSASNQFKGEYTEKSGKLMRALSKWKGELTS